MQLEDVLRVFQRSWLLIAGLTILGLLAAGAALAVTTPQYQSTSRLFVSTQARDSASDLLQGSTYTQSRMISYSHLVVQPVVLDPVISSLGLALTSDQLAGHVTANVITDSLILEVTVSEASPQQAADIANAVAAQLVSTITTQIEDPGDGTKPLIAVSIIANASPAANPTTPVSWLYLVVGGVGGLLLAIGLAFLISGFDNRVRSVDDVKRLTDLPILGHFPRQAKVRDRPLLFADDMMSQRAESFRALRTNLQYFDLAVNHQVLLFTSSIPGEGKTTTSLNLAIALAQTGKKVLYIECDLRRPKSAKYLNVEGAVGLSDVLVSRAELADVLQPGALPSLAILPAGALPPNPSELLGSEQFETLVTAMRHEYDYLILDAPPLLAVTDAAILSRVSDGVIVVVGTAQVKKQQLETSFEILSQVDARVLGIAANFLPRRGVDAYSYYTYGYGSVMPDRAGAEAEAALHLGAQPGQVAHEQPHSRSHRRLPALVELDTIAEATPTAEPAGDDVWKRVRTPSRR
ncbi:chromosome partitioning protein [Subtercola sp. Z020]|uniref:polysaccharide biosynthesis tyrosine autokinase n=1 Tax=Subtercola sp. Z020 TaxID=2080582 RepID=UPI000CE84E2D|nr:polysaccharide biosynthesis tyrosine autokinase [Subtercola sp. Z020]PPF82231.1 chromosome partitioning protein [Subtercola sp. Z020]